MALTDREVLLVLYKSTGGEKWNRKANWDANGAELSQWDGVEVDDEGRVVKLDLNYNNLRGVSIYIYQTPCVDLLRARVDIFQGFIDQKRSFHEIVFFMGSDIVVVLVNADQPASDRRR